MTKELFEIKHPYSGEVLFKTKAISLKVALEIGIKKDADLWGADLRDANLREANLWDADLWDANLREADLWGQKIYISPNFMELEPYRIMAFNSVIKIGCELHTIEEWEGFSDKRILEMEGKKALEWWKSYKEPILTIAKIHAEKAEKAKLEFKKEKNND